MNELKWDEFKSFIDSEKIAWKVIYIDCDYKYKIFVEAGNFKFFCELPIVEAEDFETNYKPYANSPEYLSTESVVYTSPFLKNSSNSTNMNVNGSSVNVDYTYEIPIDKKLYLESLTIIIEDNSDFGLSTFGGISQLANGLLITQISKGNTQTLARFTNNSSIYTFFKNDTWSLLTSSLISSSRFYQGTAMFLNPIELNGAISDAITVTVQDNLSNLTRLNIRANLWRYNK